MPRDFFMRFNPGDKVSFLDHTGTGVVIAVHGNNAWVKNDDGMELEYPFSKLVPRTSGKEYSTSAKDEELLLRNKLSGEKNRKKISKAHHGEKEMEIDLHIHELTDDIRGLSNTDMLRIQVLHFRKKMTEAIDKRITRLILIHGVGEGVLKAELHHALLDYHNVEVHDADYSKYGKGATEVRIRYN